MAILELDQGVKNVGLGATNIRGRCDRVGATVVTLAHQGQQEATLGAGVMIASNAVAGVAPGTALSTTPPMALWNPPSSGKNLSITRVSIGYVSGTLGGGSILLAQQVQTTVPTTGTELTPVCSLLGFPRGVGRAFTGSTISAAPTIIRPSMILGAALASTAFFPMCVYDDVCGEIVVPQGIVFCVQGLAAAGTSPLVIIAVTYEETPA